MRSRSRSPAARSRRWRCRSSCSSSRSPARRCASAAACSRRGGRLAAYTTAPELRGTPAAPEPLAAHLHFHTDAELAALARAAGFRDVAVADDDGGQLVTGRA